MKKIKAFAPATIANFIVGFDSLGASIETLDEDHFGDIVSITQAQNRKIEITGKYAHHLPKNPDDNIVSYCIEAFHQTLTAKGIASSSFHLQLEKRLPIGSGLGSSASSIVAALTALNAYYDKALTDGELLLIAGNMEARITGCAHYDNVAPSLLGGLQLMIPQQLSEPLPWFEDWLLVLYHPGIEVSTKMAREILPDSFTLATVVNYWQKFAAFIHALYANNRQLAATLLNDKLIEPYRAQLIPHFEAGRTAALNAGALAFGISGSGPTCFAIADSLTSAKKISALLPTVMQSNSYAFCKIAKISSQGAKIIERSHHESI